MNFPLKKLIIFLIIFSVLFNSSGFLNLNFFNPESKPIPFKSISFKFSPPKAEAFWWSTFAQQLVDYALQIWQWIKDNWQKMMRDIIAKRILDYIVDQTVEWIQGGGEPKFVTNWEGFLKDAGDIAFESVVRETGMAALCSPFKPLVQISLLPVPKFSQRVTCTLDDVVENIEGFYQSFENGSWIAYNEAWQPQNNYYGTMMIIHDEASARANSAVQAASAKAAAGQGFLAGATRCKGGGITPEQEGGGPSGIGATEDYLKSQGYVKDTTGKYCKPTELEETTPGSIVAKAVGEGLTSDIQWAANIESWISALLNAVINRLVREGVAYMTSSKDAPESDTYYPPDYKHLRDEENQTNKQKMINEINKFANGWQSLLYYKNNSLSSVSSTKAILLQMQNMLCTPSVTADEIDIAQSDFDRLTIEVTDLNIKLFEANDAIEIIISADFTNSRDSANAQAAYQSFIEKYNNQETLIEIGEENINAARDESQAKASRLNDIRLRFATCQPLTP